MPTDPQAPAVDVTRADHADRTLVEDLDSLVAAWEEASSASSEIAAGRIERRRMDRTNPAPHPATMMLRGPGLREGAPTADVVAREASARPPTSRDHTLAYGGVTAGQAEEPLSVVEGADRPDPTVALGRAELLALARRSRSIETSPRLRNAPGPRIAKNPTPRGGLADGPHTLAGRPAFDSEPEASPPVQSLTSKAVAGAAVLDGAVQPTLDMTGAVRQAGRAAADASTHESPAPSPILTPLERPAVPAVALDGLLELQRHEPREPSADKPADVPRPRGLSERVAVGTDGPLVRSPRLQPASPRPIRESDPTEPPELGTAMAAAARSRGVAPERQPVARSTQARALAVRRDVRLAVVLVVATLLAPGLADGELVGPWSLLTAPGSANFVAAGFVVLLVAALAAPTGRLLRASILTMLGLGLLVFSSLLGAVAVKSGAYALSPTASTVYIGPSSLRMLIVVAACGVPVALMWRALGLTRGVGPRIAAGASLAVVVFAYGALSTPSGHALIVGLVALVSGVGADALVGDRIVALLALLPVLSAAGAAIVFVPGATRRGVHIAANAFRVTVMLPLVGLALLSAGPGESTMVLMPLQIVALTCAGYVLLTTALGEVLARLGHT